eukprot:scaffold43425_cov57-Attheya_sp.AAC.2
MARNNGVDDSRKRKGCTQEDQIMEVSHEVDTRQAKKKSSTNWVFWVGHATGGSEREGSSPNNILQISWTSSNN